MDRSNRMSENRRRINSPTSQSFFNERDREMNRYDQDQYDDRSHTENFGPSNRSWGEDIEHNRRYNPTGSDRLGSQRFQSSGGRNQPYPYQQDEDMGYQSQSFRNRFAANDYGQDDYFPADDNRSLDRLNNRSYDDTLPRGRSQDRSGYGRSSGTNYGGDDSYRQDGQRSSRGFRGRGPKNFARTDERIREDVCHRLMDSDEIDAQEIDVKVENGAVILSGTVDNKRTKYLAEDVAEYVSGVTEVENNLKVNRSASSMSSSANASEQNMGSKSRSTDSSSKSGAKNLN